MVTTSNPPKIELDKEVEWILGRPVFYCAPLAEALRQKGWEIQTKIEVEQAVVIHWMLNLYLEHGEGWREIAKATIRK